MRAKFNFNEKPEKFDYTPKSKNDLITVLFVVTNKCTHKCKFCIEDVQNNYEYEQELNPKEFLNIVDQITECGAREIILSGGEPLLRKDFKQIVKRIKDNGMRAIICTNGYYLDEELVDFLEEVKLDTIQISVNSLNKEIYNNLCNPPEDGYDRMLKSIDLVKKKFSGRVILSSVPLKANKHTLIDIMRLCKEKGFERFSLFKPAPVGSAEKNSELILSEEEYIELLDELIQEFVRLGGKEVFIEQPYARYSKLAKKYGDILHFDYICIAGFHYFSITPDGHIVPCASMSHMKELYKGDLRKEPLKKIWEDNDRWRLFRTENECKNSCEYFKICRGGCRLMSYLATGNVLAEDPLCKLWIGNIRKNSIKI